MTQCEIATPDPMPHAVATPFYAEPAFWMWVALLVAVAVFDVVQIRRHKWTLSQYLQHLGRSHGWFKWFVLGVCVLAGVHFGWGF